MPPKKRSAKQEQVEVVEAPKRSKRGKADAEVELEEIEVKADDIDTKAKTKSVAKPKATKAKDVDVEDIENDTDRNRTKDLEETKDEISKNETSKIKDTQKSVTGHTIYINNLNQKIKLPVLKETLANLFSPFGQILSITAHKNVRLRGQAFVCFANGSEKLQEALECDGMPLYGRIIKVCLAKTDSDDGVKSRDPASLDEHKRLRAERKVLSRKKNPYNLKMLKKFQNKEDVVKVVEEETAPNRILFVQNLKESSKEDVLRIFERFEGLLEVRVVPGRGVAFVEFGSIPEADVARMGVNGLRMAGKEETSEGEAEKERVRVSFAKQ